MIGISQLSRRERHEVATALSLVTLLGLGTLFLSLTSEYSQEVYALLFGEVLGISTARCCRLPSSARRDRRHRVLFRPLLLNSLSPDLGEAHGVRAGAWNSCF